MQISFAPLPFNKNVDAVIPAPVSKSDIHRKLILAALCREKSKFLCGKNLGADIRATLGCLPALGAKHHIEGESIFVEPGFPATGDFPCGESGSTLRFLLPVAAVLGLPGSFSGEGRLPERPLGELLSEFSRHQVFATSAKLPLALQGRWQGDFEAQLPGNVSSQYISGFMLAFAAAGSGRITLTTKLQSSGYIDMTINVLKNFGVAVQKKKNTYILSGKPVSPGVLPVEGDWSNSAVLLAAGAIGGRVAVSGLSVASAQGDREIAMLLHKFGAGVSVNGDSVCVSQGELCGAGDIDIGNIPDLAPVLAIVAAYAKGVTTLVNASRLRIKESDRLAGSAEMLTALGVKVECGSDFLLIRGKGNISGGKVDVRGDHRFVMASALAALRANSAVEISGVENVGKSWPDFLEVWRQITGRGE